MPHKPHNFRALSKPKSIQKSHHKHYWPYIPLLLVVIATLLLNSGLMFRTRGVLAYATNMSSDGLLQATNNQRVKAGVGSLQFNNALASAAQAKAQDMVSRNYWSHNTPDGQEPWVFVNNAGYKYQKAGENLAYGFLSSSETVTGWMNSQSHRANMLDGAYSDVGFGFVNSENYTNNGQQTVVVAMYGVPQVQSATANQVPAPEQPEPATRPTAAIPVPASAAPTDTTRPTQEIKENPVTSAMPVQEPTSLPVARVQNLTGGHAPWTSFAVGMLTGLAVTMILARHAASLRHLLRDSERFILHHPLLDTLLVSMVAVGSFLSQTSGYIR